MPNLVQYYLLGIKIVIIEESEWRERNGITFLVNIYSQNDVSE